jgi:beta-alanine--pyruvate transaminase
MPACTIELHGRSQSTAGFLIRVTGDILALSPPLIVEEDMVDEMVSTLGRVLSETA